MNLTLNQLIEFALENGVSIAFVPQKEDMISIETTEIRQCYGREKLLDEEYMIREIGKIIEKSKK